jgi:uncharacterized protein YbaA (DUF1428 family)
VDGDRAEADVSGRALLRCTHAYGVAIQKPWSISMAYVDGFVLPISRKNLPAYRRIARKASKVWMEHGALEYRECAGDDLDVPMGVPFTKLLKLKRGETAVFAYIVYKSRAHRDRVNAKVMKDPRLANMDPKSMPFDCERIVWGGFKSIVEA